MHRSWTGPFKTQSFAQKVAKVSHKGWTVHQRILWLDAQSLRYYRNVPKRNLDPTDHEHIKAANPAGPKVALDLARIKLVGVNEEIDQKTFKKLKASGSYFIKIQFYEDGILDFKEEAEKGQATSATNQMSKQPSSDEEENQMETTRGASQAWFFQCSDEDERDELLSKIYMNAYSKIEKAGDTELLQELARNQDTQNIVQSFIEKMEDDESVIDERELRKRLRAKKKASQFDEDDDEDSLQKYEEDLSADEESMSDDALRKPQYKGEPKLNDLGLVKTSSTPGQKNELKKQDTVQSSKNSGRLREQNQLIINAGQKLHQENSDGKQKESPQPKGGQQQKKKQTSLKNIYLLNRHFDQDKQVDDQVARQIYQKLEMLSNDERQLQKEMEELEAKGWDLKFQNYWTAIVHADGNLEQQQAMCERLFEHIGSFRAHAGATFRRIVDRMHVPTSKAEKDKSMASHSDLDDHENREEVLEAIAPDRLTEEELVFMDECDASLYNESSHTERSDHPSHLYSLEGANIYCRDNIFFKITNRNEVVYTRTDASNYLGGEGRRPRPGTDPDGSSDEDEGRGVSNPQHQNELRPLGAHQSVHKWKLFGRHFLSMDVLFDTLFMLQGKETQTKFRIPLSTLMDYKGFRCLAIGKLPIQPDINPILGFHEGSYVPSSLETKKALGSVGAMLQLKDDQVMSGQTGTQEDAPLSYFAKVYSYSSDQISDMHKNQCLPSKLSSNYHYRELNYRDQQDLHYIVKSSEIFPVDHERDGNMELCPRHPNYFLRPEFFSNYEEQLSANCLKGFQNLQIGVPNRLSSDDLDVQDLTSASQYLKTKVIKDLVKKLDDLEILPIDSESLRQVIRDHGVNMRYLSHIFVLSEVPHVRELCVTEMLARTFKNIVNTKLSELALENKLEHKQLVKRAQDLDREINRLKHPKYRGEKLAKSDLFDGDEGAVAHDQGLQSLLEQKNNVQQLMKQKENAEMHDEALKFIVDILNLLFGRGEETDYFWDHLLFRECMHTFGINEAMRYHSYQDGIDQILNRQKVNLTALFFAIVHLLNLAIDPFHSEQAEELSRLHGSKKGSQDYQFEYTQRMLGIFNLFGKAEKPFGEMDTAYKMFDIEPRTKVYQMRSTPYRQLIERMHKQVNDQRIEEALKSGQAKMKLHFLLYGGLDLTTLADMAELAIEQGQLREAIIYAEEGIQQILPLHAERIRFYCILIKAYFKQDKVREAETYFQMTTETIMHHLGPSHPIHITVYGIMATLLIPRSKWEEAMYLFKSSMMCCMKSLGPNHVQTAQLHMDFGQFYLRWSKRAQGDQRDQALSHFEQAYMIFENYFDEEQDYMEETEVIGDAAMNIATIMEEQNRLQEAHFYVIVAFKKYRQIYGPSAESTILAQWLMLQIEYSQSKQADDSVVKQADTLLSSLQNRDQKVSSKQWRDRIGTDELKEEMQRIKILCIVTHILEMTRCLRNEQKQNLESFCDKLMLKKKDKNHTANSLAAYKKDNIDLLTIRRVASLPLKKDKRSQEFLNSLYTQSVKEKGRFRLYYREKIQNAINKERQQDEDKKAAGRRKRGGDDQSTAADEGPKVERSLDATEVFFDQLLDLFETVNFYNLLQWNSRGVL